MSAWRNWQLSLTNACKATYLLVALAIFGIPSTPSAAPLLEQIGEFTVPEANQGMGVDARHFYAV